MKNVFRDFYGGSASMRIKADGSVALRVVDSYGKVLLSKSYASERGAKIAMGRMGDCWREVKG